MKKLLISALGILGFAGAQAQSASSQYSVTVPKVLSISTTPDNATFSNALSQGELENGKTLPTVIWNVKSNVNWKAMSMWAVTGLASNPAYSSYIDNSVTAFRNALKYSSDGGATWNSLQPANIYFVDPIPGYGNMSPTAAGGLNVEIRAKLLPTAYVLVPGNYIATTIVTVTAL
jgi:hypothetical protein